MIWGPFCFSKFCQEMSELCSILWFVQIVHTNFHAKSGPVNFNFHAKSGLCSSRNEWVLLNFVIWRQFCFSKFCQNLFRLSIPTSIQNLESVAQKMSKLWHLVQKRMDILGAGGQRGIAHYLQRIIQSKLVCAKFASLDKNA